MLLLLPVKFNEVVRAEEEAEKWRVRGEIEESNSIRAEKQK